MVQTSIRSFGFFLVVTVLATIAVEVSSLQEGWSIPAFSRKYSFECKDCHVGASTKLNEFGQLFREQGYQLPANHSRVAGAYREEPDAPKVIFERYCEACHGVEGKGDGPMGQVLIPPAADLTSQSSKSKSDDDLLRIIQEGTLSTTMPAFKRRLTEQELRSVLAYIRSLSE